MEFHIERDPLLKALSRIQTVVERRSTKPILSNALVETQEGFIKISATNQEVSLRTLSPAEIVRPGSLTVNAKTLYEVVRELPVETVTIRKDDRDRVHLSCGMAKFELAGLSPDLFPEIPQADGDDRFGVDPLVLADMLNKTHFATSFDENRFTLNGLFFQVVSSEEGARGGTLRLVATDTHRLAMVERWVEILPANLMRELIIPRKTVQEIRRMLEEDMDTLEVILDDTYIQLVKPALHLISKLVEGRFPDYRRVIPKENPLHLTVDREALFSVVRRMSVLSHEKSRGIRLEIQGARMQFYTNNPEQELAEEEMQVALEGGDALQVGFNARYLKEFLAVMEGTSARFSLKNDESPVLLTDPDQPGTHFVLMPMRV